jgi:hypothetical protein
MTFVATEIIRLLSTDTKTGATHGATAPSKIAKLAAGTTETRDEDVAGYKAPLRDMRLVLHELHGDAPLGALPQEENFSAELVDQILRGAARLGDEVLHPLNRRGDEEGCRFENGVVRNPAGFADAYRAYREGGWASLACRTEFGGQAARTRCASSSRK